MLASPIMPMSLLPTPGKRRLYGFEDVDMYRPRAKRPRIFHSRNSSDGNHASGASYMPIVERRAASIKAELQLSNLLKEEEHSTSKSTSILKNCCKGASGIDDDGDDIMSNHKIDQMASDKIPVVKGDVKVAGTCVVEKTCTFSTPSSDVESDCSENSRTSIPKSKIKQPSILLVKMNKPIRKKEKKASAPGPVPSPYTSNVVVGGYVHRMASLNARACVAAYLEPEKKYAPKKTMKSANKSPSLTAIPTSEIAPSKPVLVRNEVEKIEEVLKCESHESQNDSEVLKPEPVVCPEVGVEEVSYNKVGILYNGDSVYPSAQVFLSGDTEPRFPTKILPTLVPTRLSSVKLAATKAASTGVVNMDKKHSRKNNGWHPLGHPVKVINYFEGVLKKKCRKYYAGIRRKNEDIYVRDCVVIKSDIESGEKPFVAKIGSIWQEPNGYIMMTTFWYYRPDDVSDQSLAVACVGRELLASQHHDVNSVACIEDKCFVLGLSQYCRYHASIVKSTVCDPFNSDSHSADGVVPKLLQSSCSITPQSDAVDAVINLIELDPIKQKEDLGPSLSELQRTDPFLVFLCYRGYNHISGRVQNGRQTRWIV